MAGLGRGLGSLIPQKVNKQDNGPATPATSIADIGERIQQLDPKKIQANDQQPRTDFNDESLDELAASIKQHGIQQPLVVSQVGSGYQLITGERRLRAAKRLNLPTVPAIVRAADKQKRLELALIENIQRQDLNPLELGAAYRRLTDEFNLTDEEAGARLGKSRPYITNTIRLLGLPEPIKQALVDGRISEGHAKVILGFDSEAKQFELFNKIVANKMTVAQSVLETKKMGGTMKALIRANPADPDREAKLQSFFGVKTSIRRKKYGGQIVLDFWSDEELGEIMRKVS
jgi:ParB family chromosome partitioning protein